MRVIEHYLSGSTSPLTRDPVTGPLRGCRFRLPDDVPRRSVSKTHRKVQLQFKILDGGRLAGDSIPQIREVLTAAVGEIEAILEEEAQ